MTLEEKVKAALASVLDPEMGISVTSMGLVREVVEEGEGKIRIKMMLTSPSCPFAPQILASVRAAAERVEGVKSVSVEFEAPEWWPKEAGTRKT